MKAIVNAKIPERTEVSIEFKLTLEEWRELHSQLAGNWPSWKFGNLLKSVLEKVCLKWPDNEFELDT